MMPKTCEEAEGHAGDEGDLDLIVVEQRMLPTHDPLRLVVDGSKVATSAMEARPLRRSEREETKIPPRWRRPQGPASGVRQQ
eukprot:scaffold7714_cov25-Tisochrysis_lutea.AAC.8